MSCRGFMIREVKAMDEDGRREPDRHAKAFQAQLKADKRTCACGRDAEVMVCKHLFHGYSHGHSLNLYWIWTGILYCANCNYELQAYHQRGIEVEPTMLPICKRCTKLIFESL